MDINWKGKHRGKNTEFKKGQVRNQTNEKNHMWKGNNAGYTALHYWVSKRLGKAAFCSNDINHKTTRYVWGNISGEYKRDISDWHSLCGTCNLTDGIKMYKIFDKKRHRIIMN